MTKVSALLCHVELGSVVQTPILACLVICSYIYCNWYIQVNCPLISPFATMTSQFILSIEITSSNLDLMGVMCMNTPYLWILAHVFPTIDLYLENIVSVYNLKFNCYNIWDINSVLYCHVIRLSDYLTLSSVLCSIMRFTFYGPTDHLFASRLAINPWWCLSMYAA